MYEMSNGAIDEIKSSKFDIFMGSWAKHNNSTVYDYWRTLHDAQNLKRVFYFN